MQLDERLNSVVGEISDSNVTIDVGTDHGKVILTALMEGRCASGIASDISADSLDKARELADRLNIPLDTRLGDGLSVTKEGEVDTAVIAGMGGNEIVKILGDATWQVPKLILVPHRDARLVRRYLASHNYAIDKDYMVMEGNFYYNIIVASVGKCTLSERAEYLGLSTIEDETFAKYIHYRAKVLRGILAKTDNDMLRRELDLIERELV